MTEFESYILETKCKTCRRSKNCLWLLKKRNRETCCGVFYVLDKRKVRKNETV